MILLGIFFGIQRSHGKGQVAITGIAGINGMKMRTSTILAPTRIAPVPGCLEIIKLHSFLADVTRFYANFPGVLVPRRQAG